MTVNESLQDRIIRTLIGLTVTVGAIIMAAAVPVLSPTGIVNLFFLVLGIEVFVTGLIGWSPVYSLFGEAMMFIYYICLFPLATRIARGFYKDGVWSDTGFMPWSQISAVSWRDEGSVTLMLISHGKSIARRLEVPGAQYGEARRVLLDRVKAHDIHIGGAGLNLGTREEGDSI